MMSDEPKLPFDVPAMLVAIEDAVRAYPKAAMFELAERGYGTVFQQLVACIVSIRTRDETSLPIALSVLGRAPDPAKMAGLTVDEIDALIADSTFHEAKAGQIHAIAKQAVVQYGGGLPADYAILTSFAGVGPKCANLALGVSTGLAGISVDIHVHRVTNRWGLVSSPSPERTMVELERVVPRKHWLDLNRLLVPFGKHICTGRLPICSTCPVLAYCRQVGVSAHR